MKLSNNMHDLEKIVQLKSSQVMYLASFPLEVWFKGPVCKKKLLFWISYINCAKNYCLKVLLQFGKKVMST